MKKLFTIGTIGLVSTLLLTGCGSGDETENKEIRVGTSPGPYSELFLDGIKPILEEDGYTVKETPFDALLQADVALNDGDIDVNVDQHTAYLENFNENSDANLVGLVSIPTVPAGIFGGRKDNLDAVEEGDVVAIPDDASNAARALLLLEKAGWITLDENVDPIEATSSNIAENPLNLDIVEMNSAQIPRSLEDIDYGVIPGSIVYSADIPAEDSLLSEDILKEYELVVTVDEENADTDWAKAIVDAYKSDEFAEFLKGENENNYWFIPADLQQ
ncbi:metal ABC transporter substrate-binding protein [Enterococcus saccharolyticus]|uniref:Metal ABC transporter substrate-binding protein n=1 Tax=Candidatus Enterococcus willemsii TaxID=1857215 RepID=A0ABQ6Z1M1_9ENTE|nr:MULTISPECIES: MetQ/NlpA family ABC transporter substrate-binding protein [Enterococcus]KAF1305208.1 metal ABC transporter substrate-binding protein [Enterococcus sp. CU12B]MCD5003411.1 metal ABC transporter substrate-binding protein [Enterococcus saccharolyticus]